MAPRSLPSHGHALDLLLLPGRPSLSLWQISIILQKLLQCEEFPDTTLIRSTLWTHSLRSGSPVSRGDCSEVLGTETTWGSPATALLTLVFRAPLIPSLSSLSFQQLFSFKFLSSVSAACNSSTQLLPCLPNIEFQAIKGLWVNLSHSEVIVRGYPSLNPTSEGRRMGLTPVQPHSAMSGAGGRACTDSSCLPRS